MIPQLDDRLAAHCLLKPLEVAGHDAPTLSEGPSEIVDLRNKDSDPRLIKTLVHIVSIFPIGSLVKLKNLSNCHVIRTNRRHSARPLIEILIDTRGNRLDTSKFLNLEDKPMIYIVDLGIDESVLKQKPTKRLR